tara:strand:+ start:1802 stop:13900 length:12099 start_codon:yes stop_codon:yes gene_type:complete
VKYEELSDLLAQEDKDGLAWEQINRAIVNDKPPINPVPHANLVEGLLPEDFDNPALHQSNIQAAPINTPTPATIVYPEEQDRVVATPPLSPEVEKEPYELLHTTIDEIIKQNTDKSLLNIEDYTYPTNYLLGTFVTNQLLEIQQQGTSAEGVDAESFRKLTDILAKTSGKSLTSMLIEKAWPTIPPNEQSSIIGVIINEYERLNLPDATYYLNKRLGGPKEWEIIAATTDYAINNPKASPALIEGLKSIGIITDRPAERLVEESGANQLQKTVGRLSGWLQDAVDIIATGSAPKTENHQAVINSWHSYVKTDTNSERYLFYNIAEINAVQEVLSRYKMRGILGEESIRILRSDVIRNLDEIGSASQNFLLISLTPKELQQWASVGELEDLELATFLEALIITQDDVSGDDPFLMRGSVGGTSSLEKDNAEQLWMSLGLNQNQRGILRKLVVSGNSSKNTNYIGEIAKESTSRIEDEDNLLKWLDEQIEAYAQKGGTWPPDQLPAIPQQYLTPRISPRFLMSIGYSPDFGMDNRYIGKLGFALSPMVAIGAYSLSALHDWSQARVHERAEIALANPEMNAAQTFAYHNDIHLDDEIKANMRADAIIYRPETIAEQKKYFSDRITQAQRDGNKLLESYLKVWQFAEDTNRNASGILNLWFGSLTTMGASQAIKRFGVSEEDAGSHYNNLWSLNAAADQAVWDTLPEGSREEFLSSIGLTREDEFTYKQFVDWKDTFLTEPDSRYDGHVWRTIGLIFGIQDENGNALGQYHIATQQDGQTVWNQITNEEREMMAESLQGLMYRELNENGQLELVNAKEFIKHIERGVSVKEALANSLELHEQIKGAFVGDRLNIIDVLPFAAARGTFKAVRGTSKYASIGAGRTFGTLDTLIREANGGRRQVKFTDLGLATEPKDLIDDMDDYVNTIDSAINDRIIPTDAKIPEGKRISIVPSTTSPLGGLIKQRIIGGWDDPNVTFRTVDPYGPNPSGPERFLPKSLGGPIEPSNNATRRVLDELTGAQTFDKLPTSVEDLILAKEELLSLKATVQEAIDRGLDGFTIESFKALPLIMQDTFKALGVDSSLAGLLKSRNVLDRLKRPAPKTKAAFRQDGVYNQRSLVPFTGAVDDQGNIATIAPYKTVWNMIAGKTANGAKLDALGRVSQKIGQDINIFRNYFRYNNAQSIENFSGFIHDLVHSLGGKKEYTAGEDPIGPYTVNNKAYQDPSAYALWLTKRGFPVGPHLKDQTAKAMETIAMIDLSIVESIHPALFGKDKSPLTHWLVRDEKGNPLWNSKTKQYEVQLRTRTTKMREVRPDPISYQEWNKMFEMEMDAALQQVLSDAEHFDAQDPSVLLHLQNQLSKIQSRFYLERPGFVTRNVMTDFTVGMIHGVPLMDKLRKTSSMHNTYMRGLEFPQGATQQEFLTQEELKIILRDSSWFLSALNGGMTFTRKYGIPGTPFQLQGSAANLASRIHGGGIVPGITHMPGLHFRQLQGAIEQTTRMKLTDSIAPRLTRRMLHPDAVERQIRNLFPEAFGPNGGLFPKHPDLLPRLTEIAGSPNEEFDSVVSILSAIEGPDIYNVSIEKTFAQIATEFGWPTAIFEELQIDDVILSIIRNPMIWRATNMVGGATTETDQLIAAVHQAQIELLEQHEDLKHVAGMLTDETSSPHTIMKTNLFNVDNNTPFNFDAAKQNIATRQLTMWGDLYNLIANRLGQLDVIPKRDTTVTPGTPMGARPVGTPSELTDTRLQMRDGEVLPSREVPQLNRAIPDEQVVPSQQVATSIRNSNLTPQAAEYAGILTNQIFKEMSKPIRAVDQTLYSIKHALSSVEELQAYQYPWLWNFGKSVSSKTEFFDFITTPTMQLGPDGGGIIPTQILNEAMPAYAGVYISRIIRDANATNDLPLFQNVPPEVVEATNTVMRLQRKFNQQEAAINSQLLPTLPLKKPTQSQIIDRMTTRVNAYEGNFDLISDADRMEMLYQFLDDILVSTVRIPNFNSKRIYTNWFTPTLKTRFKPQQLERAIQEYINQGYFVARHNRARPVNTPQWTNKEKFFGSRVKKITEDKKIIEPLDYNEIGYKYDVLGTRKTLDKDGNEIEKEYKGFTSYDSPTNEMYLSPASKGVKTDFYSNEAKELLKDAEVGDTDTWIELGTVWELSVADINTTASIAPWYSPKMSPTARKRIINRIADHIEGEREFVIAYFNKKEVKVELEAQADQIDALDKELYKLGTSYMELLRKTGDYGRLTALAQGNDSMKFTQAELIKILDNDYKKGISDKPRGKKKLDTPAFEPEITAATEDLQRQPKVSAKKRLEDFAVDETELLEDYQNFHSALNVLTKRKAEMIYGDQTIQQGKQELISQVSKKAQDAMDSTFNIIQNILVDEDMAKFIQDINVPEATRLFDEIEGTIRAQYQGKGKTVEGVYHPGFVEDVTQDINAFLEKWVSNEEVLRIFDPIKENGVSLSASLNKNVWHDMDGSNIEGTLLELGPRFFALQEMYNYLSTVNRTGVDTGISSTLQNELRNRAIKAYDNAKELYVDTVKDPHLYENISQILQPDPNQELPASILQDLLPQDRPAFGRLPQTRRYSIFTEHNLDDIRKYDYADSKELQIPLVALTENRLNEVYKINEVTGKLMKQDIDDFKQEFETGPAKAKVYFSHPEFVGSVQPGLTESVERANPVNSGMIKFLKGDAAYVLTSPENKYDEVFLPSDVVLPLTVGQPRQRQMFGEKLFSAFAPQGINGREVRHNPASGWIPVITNDTIKNLDLGEMSAEWAAKAKKNGMSAKWIADHKKIDGRRLGFFIKAEGATEEKIIAGIQKLARYHWNTYLDREMVAEATKMSSRKTNSSGYYASWSSVSGDEEKYLEAAGQYQLTATYFQNVTDHLFFMLDSLTKKWEIDIAMFGKEKGMSKDKNLLEAKRQKKYYEDEIKDFKSTKASMFTMPVDTDIVVPREGLIGRGLNQGLKQVLISKRTGDTVTKTVEFTDNEAAMFLEVKISTIKQMLGLVRAQWGRGWGPFGDYDKVVGYEDYSPLNEIFTEMFTWNLERLQKRAQQRTLGIGGPPNRDIPFGGTSLQMSSEDARLLSEIIDFIRRDRHEIFSLATKQAVAAQELIMHAYNNTYNFDAAMKGTMPWMLWFSRTIGKSLMYAVDHPTLARQLNTFTTIIDGLNKENPNTAWASDNVPLLSALAPIRALLHMAHWATGKNDWLADKMERAESWADTKDIDIAGLAYWQGLFTDPWVLGKPVGDKNALDLMDERGMTGIGKILTAGSNIGSVSPIINMIAGSLGAHGDDYSLVEDDLASLGRFNNVWTALATLTGFDGIGKVGKLIQTPAEIRKIDQGFAELLMEAYYSDLSEEDFEFTMQDIRSAWDAWSRVTPKGKVSYPLISAITRRNNAHYSPLTDEDGMTLSGQTAGRIFNEVLKRVAQETLLEQGSSWLFGAKINQHDKRYTDPRTGDTITLRTSLNEFFDVVGMNLPKEAKNKKYDEVLANSPWIQPYLNNTKQTTEAVEIAQAGSFYWTELEKLSEVRENAMRGLRVNLPSKPDNFYSRGPQPEGVQRNIEYQRDIAKIENQYQKDKRALMMQVWNKFGINVGLPEDTKVTSSVHPRFVYERSNFSNEYLAKKIIQMNLMDSPTFKLLFPESTAAWSHKVADVLENAAGENGEFWELTESEIREALYTIQDEYMNETGILIDVDYIDVGTFNVWQIENELQAIYLTRPPAPSTPEGLQKYGVLDPQSNERTNVIKWRPDGLKEEYYDEDGELTKEYSIVSNLHSWEADMAEFKNRIIKEHGEDAWELYELHEAINDSPIYVIDRTIISAITGDYYKGLFAFLDAFPDDSTRISNYIKDQENAYEPPTAKNILARMRRGTESFGVKEFFGPLWMENHDMTESEIISLIEKRLVSLERLGLHDILAGNYEKRIFQLQEDFDAHDMGLKESYKIRHFWSPNKIAIINTKQELADFRKAYSVHERILSSQLELKELDPDDPEHMLYVRYFWKDGELRENKLKAEKSLINAGKIDEAIMFAEFNKREAASSAVDFRGKS